jgi:outer membrane protein assembly factor BamB
MAARAWDMRRVARRGAAACVALAAGMIVLAASAAAAGSEISIPGDHVFPESLTSTSDGTVIIGSLAQGMVYKVAPGGTTAEPWIKPGTNGLLSVLGVLADERTNTLFVCSSDLSGMGVNIPGGQKPTALKWFDLKTGEPKGSLPLPGERTLCNDIAIGPDGAAYVTDSFNPHVLRLDPDGKQFKVWVTDQRFSGEGPILDGIAFGSDGNLYVNTYATSRLFRVERKADGSAGQVTELQPSQKLDHCDGMRKYGANGLLLVEGAGRFDVLTLDGDRAAVRVLKDGMKVPVSVTQVGDTAWVLEGQLSYLFDPKLKDQKPGPFRAYAVKLPTQ